MRMFDKTVSVGKKFLSVMDTAFFSAIILLQIAAWIGCMHRMWIWIPVYASICCIVFIVRKRTADHIAKKQMRESERKRRTERLLMLSDEELSKKLGHDRFILIRRRKPDIFDVTDALRRKADAIGVFGEKKEAVDLVEKLAPGTIVYDSGELIRILFGEEQAQVGKKDAIMCFCQRNRYFMLGIVLLLLSNLVKSKIYFRLSSFLCMIIAAVSGIFRNRKGLKNFLIFLDKTGE